MNFYIKDSEGKLIIKRIVILFGLLIVSMFFIYMFLVISAIWPVEEVYIAKIGSFGDSFGVITSLFTGGALLGLILTIFIQKEELKDTREVLFEQQKSISIQQFENTFFKMLSAYQSTIKSLSANAGHKYNVTGIEALTYKYSDLINTRSSDQDINSFKSANFKGVQKKCNVFFRAGKVEHCFRVLVSMINLIENSESIETKDIYHSIAIDLLSLYEYKLFFYYCISDVGSHGLMKTVYELGYFKNISSADLAQESHWELIDIVIKK